MNTSSLTERSSRPPSTSHLGAPRQRRHGWARASRTVLGAALCGGALVGGLGACTSGSSEPQSVGASAATTVVTRSGQALTINGMPATFEAANGNYSGCTARTGSWSTPLDHFQGELPYPQLSVVLDDTSCVLTLTSLVINQQTYEASVPIQLSGSYSPTPLTFTTVSGPFFANARMTPADFSQAFALDLFVSDDMNLVPGSVSASYSTVSASGSAYEVTAPDYAADTSGVEISANSNHVVQSVSGNVVLVSNATPGTGYVIHQGELDPMSQGAVLGAYLSSNETEITTSESLSIPATALGIEAGSTVLPVTRYILVRHRKNEVASFEVISLTFNAPNSD